MEIANTPVLNLAVAVNIVGKSASHASQSVTPLIQVGADDSGINGSNNPSVVIDVPLEVQNAVAIIAQIQSSQQPVDDRLLGELSRLSQELTNQQGSQQLRQQVRTLQSLITPQANPGLPQPVVATPETASLNNTQQQPAQPAFKNADTATQALSNTVDIKI